jgi:hypothetical protein
MNATRLAVPSKCSTAALAFALLVGCSSQQARKAEGERPAAKEPSGSSPSQVLRGYKLHAPPPLSSAGDVPRFIDWAGASHRDEQEDGRKLLAAASANRAVAESFIKEIESSQRVDHSRALLVLALLGEMKSPVAEAYFREFAMRPLPERGTVIEGEIIEQTRQAELEGKAADGLAFLDTESSNRALMEIIARHPSKIVRAEAINAYLWNHGDGEEAKKALSRFVQKDDAILLDRVRRLTGETAETFNPKLDAFLRTHPEAVPPPPEKLPTARKPGERRPAYDAKPPAL